VAAAETSTSGGNAGATTPWLLLTVVI